MRRLARHELGALVDDAIADCGRRGREADAAGEVVGGREDDDGGSGGGGGGVGARGDDDGSIDDSARAAATTSTMPTTGDDGAMGDADNKRNGDETEDFQSP